LATFDYFNLVSDDVPPPPPTPDPVPDLHDEFTSTLDAAWQWRAPQAGAAYEVNGADAPGQFRLSIPEGTTDYNNLWGIDNAPEIRRRDLTSDWAIQTRLTLTGTNPYDTCCFHTGLAVSFGTHERFVFGLATGWQLRLKLPNQDVSGAGYAASIIEVRIEKEGERYLFKYRTTAEQPWTIYDTHYTAARVQWVGLMTQAWDNRITPVVADYEYFDMTQSGAPLTEGVTLYNNSNYWANAEFISQDMPDLSATSLGNYAASRC
jgi:hypothetical protein